MSEAIIYIPTYQRVDAQLTTTYLSPRWRRRCLLVARPDEAPQLRQRGHSVLECPAAGIGPTRQWILDQHDVNLLGPYLVMMDDDLRFFTRRFDDPTKFLKIQWTTEFDEMMELLLDLLDGEHPLAGLAGRSGANRQTDPVRLNNRMYDLHAINVPLIREHGWRMDRLEFMEDFDFQLQILTSGYETRMLNTYCKDDRGSNAPGGCSEYRSPERQERAARALVDAWPDFVRTRQVRAKSDGEWGMRTDVTVQWAKAAEYGRSLI